MSNKPSARILAKSAHKSRKSQFPCRKKLRTLSSSSPAWFSSQSAPVLKEVDESKLATEYQELLQQEQGRYVDFTYALSPLHLWKNRYSNALPNPETRVVLSGGQSCDYINANFVRDPQNIAPSTYIAAQAPLPNTFSDMWRMVWEYKCSLIVMLTKIFENDAPNADRYYPVAADERPEFVFADFAVSLLKEEKLCEEMVLRQFKLSKPTSTEEPRCVIHVHYTGWPDFGRPSNTQTFERLLELVDYFKSYGGPIVAHCSAGLGRTGTMIAAHIASEKLKRGEMNIDLKSLVIQLRKQRAGMVQSVHQYVFLYELLNKLVKKEAKRQQAQRQLEEFELPSETMETESTSEEDRIESEMGSEDTESDDENLPRRLLSKKRCRGGGGKPTDISASFHELSTFA